MNNILENPLFEAFSHASESTYIYVTDLETGLSRWSKDAVDYFGLENEYFYDAKNVWLEFVHPDDRAGYIEDIEAVFARTRDHHNCQYRARNKMGEYVWVECRGTIICDENDKPIIFGGMMTRIDHQSKYDSLTHLLTGYELVRTPFADNGALMLIGIDNFRNINSQHGLVYGNKVLLYLSQLLISDISNSVIYRFRGDEFAVYGKDKTAKDMKDIFNRIYEKCSAADIINGVEPFSVSGGIVEFTSENNNSTDILAKAELSVAYAKEQTTHVEVFSREIEEKHIRKTKISVALNRSIHNKFDGFRLVYQPIISNDGKEIIGCESLLRWTPDDLALGPCYPDEFISILEGNGGIIDVGYFVMRESIRQAAAWQKQYKKFNVSFNVSYLQLEDPKFVPAIIEATEQYDIDASHLIVELTESVLAADTNMVQASFEMLKKHGIKIALDDFGTGNSSFLTLHNINIDIVKLDQSFIRGLTSDKNNTNIDYAIVESVGLMCNRIGCQTVAEGVENDEIWNMISKFSFSGLQGYLFSRPVEVSEFENLLQKYNMGLEKIN